MSPDSTDFLYPFIEGDERDPEPLLIDLAASARAKADQSRTLRDTTLARLGGQIDAAAIAMAARFESTGRLFAFGNGGSATDAAGVVALFRSPPWGRPLPARSLADDTAVLTALGNDVGFELVFSRQIIAHAQPGDMAMAISTSGNSDNLLAAIGECRKRSLLTVGVAGYDGGRMGAAGLDHCLVVEADSVHRIQEAQAALLFALWSAVHLHLEGPR